MLPTIDRQDALFLDFDGTLVEIAARPSDVLVPDSMPGLLADLQAKLSGALALISGRPIADLDSLLAPLSFAAAGEHGAEIRHRPGAPVDGHERLPAEVARFVNAMGAELPGLLVEQKTASVSVHYRNAPAQEQNVRQRMARLAEQWPDYELLHGKMVVEFKPGHLNKGVAIRSLVAQPPFAGRRPVFVGDDTTDEAGFSVVNEMGGVSLRVGSCAHSAARYTLADVAAVHAWLQQLV